MCRGADIEDCCCDGAALVQVCNDPIRALQICIELGVSRVLSSGQVSRVHCM